MTAITQQDLIGLYNLQPHPEGGYFKETYRDEKVIDQKSLPQIFSGDRNISTAIYFLIPEGKKSHLHRINSDEVWHFYLGGALTLVQIAPDGTISKIVLGQNVLTGNLVQHVVPAGYWFGAFPNQGSGYSFVGCTVAPGFNFKDFEMGDRDKLLKQYPEAKEEIILLTD